MFKEFHFLENMDKQFSGLYFTLDRPEMRKALMVVLSWKTIKFKLQTEFVPSKIIQNFKKIHTQRFFIFDSCGSIFIPKKIRIGR